MNIRHELEQLRRQVGLIEFDLDDARKRLVALEAKASAEAPEAALHVALKQLPPPLPVAEPIGDYKLPEPRFEPEPERAPAFVRPEAVRETWDGRDESVPERVPFDWKARLQRLQLWPPEDGQNNEVRLGAWWATRLGTLLAVIGVVFFGVYVSLDTPPWVKFVELCAICAGVAVAGLWLEKRIPRFGAVVFAGGLALVYFCTFAGYALVPVKVLFSPAAAVGWQLASVALIVAASVGRRSVSIATMAVGLGYVTAIFSRAGGLHDFALVTAALLAVVAVGFHRWMRWEAPSVVALPGAYAIYALVLQGNWLSGEAPATAWPWVYLGGMVALFFVRDWRFVRVAHDEVGAGERWFQGANSTLAAGLGVATALTLYRGELAAFYFGTAALFGVFAALRRAQVEGDAIGAVLLAKAAGAVTLGVIEVADGRTTALALLVQAWVMLFSARRLGSRVLAVGTGLVALIAMGFFIRDGFAGMPLVSWQALGALVFVVGFAWLAAEANRALERSASGVGRGLECAGALLAAVAAMQAVYFLRPAGWEPALLMGVAAVLGAGTIGRRALAPWAAAGVLIAVANVNLWQAVERSMTHGPLIANALAVLLPGAVLGGVLGSQWMQRRVADARLPEWGALVCGVTLLGWAHVLFALAESAVALAILSVGAIALGALASVWERRHLPWLATLSGVFGFFFWREAGAEVVSAGWLTVALVAAWALPVGFHASRRHRAAMTSEPEWSWIVVAQVAVAVLITVETLPVYVSGAAYVLACAIAALGVFGLTRWPRIAVGLEASWALWAVAAWAATTGSREYSSINYTILLSVAALMAWVPAVALSLIESEEQGPWWRRRGASVQTLIATVLMLVVCARCFDGAEVLVALIAASAVAVVATRWGRVVAGRWAAIVCAASALVAAWALVGSGRAEGLGGGLAAVLMVAAAWIALPLVTGFAAGKRWVFGAAGLSLVFSAALAQRGGLDPYATVGWGLASIGVFMTGLFTRTAPYRLLGLLGLALCVPRVFLVDLDSALHRIIAFVVLGLVLLWVGFSYHRFRHFIVEEPRGN